MSAEPFKRLVRLVARAFYDDTTTRAENQPKSGRSDNRGMAVVVLDALTRRQWVKEDDLAKDLKLHSKQLRRTLRFFEEERLITRDHRRETAKGAKVFNAAIAATADGQQNGKEGEEKLKLHTHSYCCLDYAQTYDVVRYRIHRMKKRLKDELEDRNTLQEYICPNCSRRYSALDALQLISFTEDSFHCENCNSELVAESDKLAAEEKGDGEDNGRRRRREKLKELLEKMEVEVALSGMEVKAEDSKEDVASLKVLPPWMIRQGMNLTNEQRGEVKQELKPDNISSFMGPAVEKKPTDDEKGNIQQNLQEEYLKAYYAAIFKQQQEAEAAATAAATATEEKPSERRVGMKAKREEDDEGVEWDEPRTTGATGEGVEIGNAVQNLEDTNGQDGTIMEDNAAEEEEDDIDWEEG